MALLYKFRKVSEKTGAGGDPSLWEWEEEPHAARRREIIKKYPQIGKLPTHDPITAVVVAGIVLTQVAMCYVIRNASLPMVFLCGYVISGTLNHSLCTGIHEIGHNLAFGNSRPLLNRALGMVCNLPLSIPLSVSYKRYHSDHHRWMGHDTNDVDVPTWPEIRYVRSSPAKALWLLNHALIHGIRPYLKAPKIWTGMELLNFIVQMTFDFAIYKIFGGKALLYLFLGTYFGLGMHPLAAHFFSEHYMFTKNMATMSHYGPLNYILFNIGYHNEHHDFPNVPWSSLPAIKKIAPEYYDNLPNHPSWIRVLTSFVFDPNMGPHAHGIGYLSTDIAGDKAKAAPILAKEFAEGQDGCYYGADEDDAIMNRKSITTKKDS